MAKVTLFELRAALGVSFANTSDFSMLTTIRHSFHFKLEKPDNPHFECEKPDNLNFKLEKPDHLHFNREKPDHFRAGSGIVPFELGSHIYINCIKTAVHS